MLVRIFGVPLVIALGVSLVGYVLTRDRQWLRFTACALMVGFVITLMFMVLYALERFVVVV